MKKNMEMWPPRRGYMIKDSTPEIVKGGYLNPESFSTQIPSITGKNSARCRGP